MNFDPGVLAEKRAGDGGHKKEEWFLVFENARTTLHLSEAEEETLQALALASPSPLQFTIVVRLIYKYLKSRANGSEIYSALLKSVNRSPFSMRDWIDAITYFNDWLSARNRKIDLAPMLDYLDCCVAAPDAKESGHTLRALADDMLESFDYEAG